WLIALDKPAGLAVQGGSGQKRHLDALLPALVAEGAERPRLVHRLDRDTSGVLLLASSAKSAAALTAAFRERTTRKLYWALVAGLPPRPQGRIALALAKRGAPGRQKMSVEDDGDEGAGEDAVTRYKIVAKHGRKAAWLVLMPETGRTHQLRVHCAALGAPILGDGKYGGREAFPEALKLPSALMLHAREIAIPHPADGTTLRVRAPLPPHMAQAWRRLGFDPDAGERAGEILTEAALG
ncbi:MAG: RluA family pseudouridine synthase, partial [Kiloniellales bacterium]